MMRRLIMTAAATFIMLGSAYADPIVGNWKTEKGVTAAIAACGSSYCITLRNGEHKGKKIGTFNAAGGGNYKGEITDPANDKTYSGKASLSGNILKLGGCVFGGLICRNENWIRT